LETSTQEHFSLGDGHFQFGGCVLENVPPACSTPN